MFGYSWRVPLKYTSKTFRIDGGLGDDPVFQAPAVDLTWRWYYSFPTLPLWIALILAAFVPKRNRRDRMGWLLVLPLAAECVYQFLSRHLPNETVITCDPGYSVETSIHMDMMIYCIISLAMAWTVVLLLVPWLSGDSSRRFPMLRKQFGLMILLGLVALVGYFGLVVPESIFASRVNNPSGYLFSECGVFWFFASIYLVLTHFLVGLRTSHEKPFRPMLRLLLIAPTTAGIALVFAAVILCSLEGGLTENLFFWCGMFIKAYYGETLKLLLLIFLLNLPVWLLSYRWAALRQRWLAGFASQAKPITLGNRAGRVLRAATNFYVLFVVMLLAIFGVEYLRFAVKDNPIAFYQPGLKEVDDKRNAATYYRKALKPFEEIQKENRVNYNHWEMLQYFFDKETLDYAFVFAPDEPEELLAPFDKIIPELMNQLHQAGTCSDCVWKTDFAHGPYDYSLVYREHADKRFLHCWQLIPIALLQSVRLAEQQQPDQAIDWDQAIDCWRDAMTLIRFQMRENLLDDHLGSLLDNERQGLAAAARIAKRLDVQGRARLLDALESLPERESLEARIPLHEAAMESWAKNNPVELIQYVESYRRNDTTNVPDRIHAGRRYRNIDWQEVKSLMADVQKVKKLAADRRAQKEQQFGADEETPPKELSLNEEVAASLSGHGAADALASKEKAVENATKMLRAGIEILDGGKPEIVLQKKTCLPVGSEKPFSYKPEKDGSFTLSMPVEPGAELSTTPPLSLRFGG